MSANVRYAIKSEKSAFECLELGVKPTLFAMCWPTAFSHNRTLDDHWGDQPLGDVVRIRSTSSNGRNRQKADIAFPNVGLRGNSERNQGAPKNLAAFS